MSRRDGSYLIQVWLSDMCTIGKIALCFSIEFCWVLLRRYLGNEVVYDCIEIDFKWGGEGGGEERI